MRLIDADALLLEIAKLKRSPWFNDDSYPGSHAVRKEAVEIVEDLCIKDAPTIDRPQGEWVDKAISIIDDMQREGIIDYEQAWEYRMRARMKETGDE